MHPISVARTANLPRSRRSLLPMLVLLAAACADDGTGPRPPVASVTVTPQAYELVVGETRSLQATPRNASGTPLSGRSIGWLSDRPGVAAVSTAGVVTAVGPGTANVTASVEGKQASAQISVLQAPSTGPVERVELNTAEAELEEGAELQLVATPRDAEGRAVGGLGIRWSSSDPYIAYVDAIGRVHAVRHGTATISAKVHGKTATATVEVRADYAYELAYGAAQPGLPSRAYALGLAGEEPRLLLPESLFPADHSIGAIAQSPNGAQLAFVVTNQSASSIYIANRDGSDLRWLTSGAKPVWSPDGAKIAYQHRSPETHDDVWVIDADGSGAVNLTADQGAWDQSWPSWSPQPVDGSYRIAYAHFELNSPNIWTMKANGSDKQQITNTGMDDQPAWSPDGTTIAFQRSGWGARIMLIDATGGNERGLGLPLVQRSPAWSPDGQLIAFISGHETPGAEEIYTVRADLRGLTVARRTWAEGYHGLPSWIARQ